MNSKKKVVTISLHTPWWTPIYVHSCSFFAAIHGLEVDKAKVANTIVKNCRIKTTEIR